MLKKVGLENYSEHFPNQLSGGQQQRVAIARALIGEPELILADEATGALDSKSGQTIMDLLFQLNHEEKISLLIITHDHSISSRCPRAVTIKDGTIIE